MRQLIFLLFCISLYKCDNGTTSVYGSSTTTAALESTTTPFDCGWLADNMTLCNHTIFSQCLSEYGWYSYDGECCNSMAVSALNKMYPTWRNESSSTSQSVEINYLKSTGRCYETTTAVSTTTTQTTTQTQTTTTSTITTTTTKTPSTPKTSKKRTSTPPTATTSTELTTTDSTTTTSAQNSTSTADLTTTTPRQNSTTPTYLTTTTPRKKSTTPTDLTTTTPRQNSTTPTDSTTTTPAQNSTTPTQSPSTKINKKSTASSTKIQSTESSRTSEQTTTTNDTSTSPTTTNEATTSMMSSSTNSSDASTTSMNETSTTDSSTTGSSTTDKANNYTGVGNLSTQNKASESTSRPYSVSSSSPVSSSTSSSTKNITSSSNVPTTDKSTTLKPTDPVTSTVSSTSKSTKSGAETTVVATTEYPWPTGGTTRTLPGGDIILNESLESFPNCTTILRQLIYNTTTKTTTTVVTTNPEGCKSTSPDTTSKTVASYSTSKTASSSSSFSSSSSSSSSFSSSTPSSSLKTNTSTSTTGPMTTTATADPPTTTYVWPTGGTTVTLPGGLIVLNERVQQLANCTVVMTQQIYDPKTGSITYNVTSDPQQCKSTSSKSASSVTANSSISTSTTTAGVTATTTYVWPTGGTTKTLANGLIVLNERIQQLANCTVIFTQQLYDPNTGEVTYNTTSDPQGCKMLNSTTGSATTQTSTPTPTPTTTYNWPTGGTTKKLSSGLIVLNERIQQLANCTVIFTQQLYDPTTGEVTYNTTSDPQGCKTLNSTTVSSLSTTTPMSEATTTYVWPTGGTTKTLASGLIVLNERIQQLANCTLILTQQLYNPTTGAITYNVTSDPQGCKLLNSTTVSSISATTPMPEATTTYIWPTGGTTKTLPGGLIVLNEKIQQLANCTVILTQQLYNPTTGAITYNTSSDPQGCKTMNLTTASSVGATSPLTTVPTVETTVFNWPTSGTTKTLPGGLIVLSEKLVAYSNCTTVLYQLLYNITSKEQSTKNTTDPEGCKATTSTVGNSSGQTTPSIKTSTISPTTSPITCPALSIDLSYATLPSSSDLKQSYSSGDQIIHNCQMDYVFSSNRMPLNIYICLGNGTWSGTPSTCIPDKEL